MGYVRIAIVRVEIGQGYAYLVESLYCEMSFLRARIKIIAIMTVRNSTTMMLFVMENQCT